MPSNHGDGGLAGELQSAEVDPLSHLGGDPFTLLNLAWIGQAIYVAAKLGVADLLKTGPRSAAEIAALVDADAQRLESVLQALAGFGIFARDPRGRFRITPPAAQLYEESWLKDYAVLWGEQLYAAGGELLAMMRSPPTGFEVTFGAPLYEHYRSDAQAHESFARFMSRVSEWQAERIAQAMDCAETTSVVDVGGGRGAMLAALLRANPNLHGTLIDQASSQEHVQQRFDREGLNQRARFVVGDFFQPLTHHADLYYIKHVLHDWEDESCLTILRNIAVAMPDKSRLVIIEAVCSPTNNADTLVKLRDLEQLFWTGGAARTRPAWDKLVRAAGLDIVTVQPTSIADASLIWCRKKSDGVSC